MSGYIQPDNLVEAVLSDEVYHDPTDPVAPPSPNQWVFLTCDYDPNTGYYGEAWGKIVDANGNSLPPGTFSEIVQVNRGTTFSSEGEDPYLATIDLPKNTLEVNSTGVLAPDRLKTIGDDLEIVADIRPPYFVSANKFYANIRNLYGNDVAIVETGQSLARISHRTTRV